MELGKLTAPFERKKIITYKSDCTTAIVKSVLLQHIIGPAYKGVNKDRPHSQPFCRIYLYFEQLQIGIQVNTLVYPDTRTVEAIYDFVKAQKFESPESIIAKLEQQMEEGKFISNAWIEFARYAAPERADIYAKARQEYIDRREQKERELRATQAAEDAAFCREENEKTQHLIDAALETIRHGGHLKNQSIKFYRSQYDVSTYHIVNYLARKFDVQIPLKVQGWINKSLVQVVIQDGKVIKYQHYGGKSKTFFHYFNQVIAAVMAADTAQSQEA